MSNPQDNSTNQNAGRKPGPISLTPKMVSDLQGIWTEIGAVIGFAKEHGSLPTNISDHTQKAIKALLKAGETDVPPDFHVDMQIEEMNKVYDLFVLEFSDAWKGLSNSDPQTQNQKYLALEELISTLEKYLTRKRIPLTGAEKEFLRKTTNDTDWEKSGALRRAADFLATKFPKGTGNSRAGFELRKSGSNIALDSEHHQSFLNTFRLALIALDPDKAVVEQFAQVHARNRKFFDFLNAP